MPTCSAGCKIYATRQCGYTTTLPVAAFIAVTTDLASLSN